MLATYHRHTEAVDALIKAGADLNAKNNKGHTALRLATRARYTALRRATRARHTDIVALLEPTEAEKRAATAKLFSAAENNNVAALNQAIAGVLM